MSTRLYYFSQGATEQSSNMYGNPPFFQRNLEKRSLFRHMTMKKFRDTAETEGVCPKQSTHE